MNSSRRDFLCTGVAAIPGAGIAGWRGPRLAERELPPAKRLPRIRVHKEGHFLEMENGAPFFWAVGHGMGIHSRDNAEREFVLDLHTRAMQGFTVIQTVVLLGVR